MRLKDFNNNSDNQQSNSNNNVSYIRQSTDVFLSRYRKFKAFYVDRKDLQDVQSIDNKNRETFKP